jgi:hypothetical protein
MFGGYGYPYDANTALAGAASNTPGRVGIWTPIERAKQLGGLGVSLLMHRNEGEEACLDSDEVRVAAGEARSEREPSRSYRGLRSQ